jgi:hypothetical protein
MAKNTGGYEARAQNGPLTVAQGAYRPGVKGPLSLLNAFT